MYSQAGMIDQIDPFLDQAEGIISCVEDRGEPQNGLPEFASVVGRDHGNPIHGPDPQGVESSMFRSATAGNGYHSGCIRKHSRNGLERTCCPLLGAGMGTT